MWQPRLTHQLRAMCVLLLVQYLWNPSRLVLPTPIRLPVSMPPSWSVSDRGWMRTVCRVQFANTHAHLLARLCMLFSRWPSRHSPRSCDGMPCHRQTEKWWSTRSQSQLLTQLVPTLLFLIPLLLWLILLPLLLLLPFHLQLLLARYNSSFIHF